jgi:hypothetical protein
MPDIFLSYSRPDRPVAQALADEFRKLGVEVWWDHALLGGDDFRKAISEILSRVEAAIVIWSRHSVDSQFVIGEAAAARERKLLIPVCIYGQTPPIDFQPLHTIDLSDWSPGEPLPEDLLRAVGTRLGRDLTYGEPVARSGSITRFARQATQGWYFDFEALLFYFIGQGFACSLVNIPVVLFTADMERNALSSAWPPWAPYLLALLNGILVAALYMRPALETRRLKVAAPLLAVATLISIPAYFTMLALFSANGEKQLLNLVGPLTLVFLMVTAIAQRATVRR